MLQHGHPHRSHALHAWELGLVASAGTLISAPYILPLLGVGDRALSQKIIDLCSTTNGGLTQAIEGALGSVPGIGKWLAGPGWWPSIVSGLIGIGGILLGDYVHRHYDRKGGIQWGTIIKYTALATSILIALPSILSGISMGIAYLAGLAGNDAFNATRSILTQTLGFSGIAHTAPTGLAGLVPHLFTCGRALLPAGLTWFASNQQKQADDGQSVHCQMATPCTPIRKQPCEVTFRLIDHATGRALTEEELQIIHTRPLHTMIVDSSLRDYHHLHPTYDPARQCFVCRFTPNLQTPYTMWNDFTVKGEKTPTYLRTDLSPIRGLSIPPNIKHSSQVEGDGISLDIGCDTPLRSGGHHTLTLALYDNAGRALIDLQPLMGSYAHLVAFSADGRHFLHTHPLGPEPSNDSAHGTSPLHFHVMPEISGPTQFFLQIQRNGNIQTIPFGQWVEKSREPHTASRGTRKEAFSRYSPSK